MSDPSSLAGLLLVQMTGDTTIETEFFAGQTADQVTGFDNSAKYYYR
jgi:hypothetical protein